MDTRANGISPPFLHLMVVEATNVRILEVRLVLSFPLTPPLVYPHHYGGTQRDHEEPTIIMSQSQFFGPFGCFEKSLKYRGWTREGKHLSLFFLLQKTSMSNSAAAGRFPSHARVLVIGGGIIGASVAYHCSKLTTGVVLVERARITSGTTFHAAGLVGQLRSNANITKLLKYSTELYNQLESETGVNPGWVQNGCLRLACSKDRMTEFKRAVTTARSFGLDMDMLSPEDCLKQFPCMDHRDVLGGAFCATDGQASPVDLTMALIAGARKNGALIFEECPVEEILLGVSTSLGKHVTGVKLSVPEEEPDDAASPSKDAAVPVNAFQQSNTQIPSRPDDKQKGTTTTAASATTVGRRKRGTVSLRCDTLVNCCGQWATGLTGLHGLPLATQPLAHEYFISDNIEGVARGMASVRDPDRRLYYKEEVGGLVVGGYEPNPLLPPKWPQDKVTGETQPPKDFIFSLFEPHFVN